MQSKEKFESPGTHKVDKGLKIVLAKRGDSSTKCGKCWEWCHGEREH